jgi:hypothetical protein
LYFFSNDEFYVKIYNLDTSIISPFVCSIIVGSTLSYSTPSKFVWGFRVEGFETSIFSKEGLPLIAFFPIKFPELDSVYFVSVLKGPGLLAAKELARKGRSFFGVIRNAGDGDRKQGLGDFHPDKYALQWRVTWSCSAPSSESEQRIDMAAFKQCGRVFHFEIESK